MIPSVLSRLVILIFGTLYPAYSSYKAVRTKNVREYVKWMMYWIVFALFTCAETFTDIFLSFWFPFYYEFKIILVVYLLSPATNGSSILYRKFVHPALIKREQEIDEYISKAMEQGYHTVLNLGSKSVAYATSVLMQTAIRGLPLVAALPPPDGSAPKNDPSSDLEDLCLKEDSRTTTTLPSKSLSMDYLQPGKGKYKEEVLTENEDLPPRSPTKGVHELYRAKQKSGGGLVNHIKKSYSLDDINTKDQRSRKEAGDDVDGREEDQLKLRRKKTYSPRRTISAGSHDLYFPEIEEYKRSSVPIDRSVLSHIRSSEDISSGYSSTEPLSAGSQYDSKDNLLRTASMGPTTRTRTRLAKKTISEDESGCSTTEPDESQCETDDFCDYPILPGKFFAPMIRPEYRYLFENLTREQMDMLFYNANFLPPEGRGRGPETYPPRRPVEEPPVATAPEPEPSRVTSPPSAILRSIMTETKDEVEADKKDETETRSGKYNKRPAPVPPAAEDEQDFCTPDSSPVLPRKAEEAPEPKEKDVDPEETERQEQNVTETKPEKKKTKKTKSGESHISKMLHLSKIQFPFWNQKGGKHSPVPSETSSVSGVSLQDSYIPLKVDEPEEPAKVSPGVDVREMSNSPSSKRRSTLLE